MRGPSERCAHALAGPPCGWPEDRYTGARLVGFVRFATLAAVGGAKNKKRRKAEAKAAKGAEVPPWMRELPADLREILMGLPGQSFATAWDPLVLLLLAMEYADEVKGNSIGYVDVAAQMEDTEDPWPGTSRKWDAGRISNIVAPHGWAIVSVVPDEDVGDVPRHPLVDEGSQFLGLLPVETSAHAFLLSTGWPVIVDDNGTRLASEDLLELSNELATAAMLAGRFARGVGAHLTDTVSLTTINRFRPWVITDGDHLAGYSSGTLDALVAIAADGWVYSYPQEDSMYPSEPEWAAAALKALQLWETARVRGYSHLVVEALVAAPLTADRRLGHVLEDGSVLAYLLATEYTDLADYQIQLAWDLIQNIDAVAAINLVLAADVG